MTRRLPRRSFNWENSHAPRTDGSVIVHLENAVRILPRAAHFLPRSRLCRAGRVEEAEKETVLFENSRKETPA